MWWRIQLVEEGPSTVAQWQGADRWGGRCRRRNSSSSSGNCAWWWERQSLAESCPSSLLPEVAFSLSFNVLFVCVYSFNPLSLLSLFLSPSSRSKSKMIQYKKNKYSVSIYICMYVCIFIWKYTHTYTCIYIKEDKRKGKGGGEKKKVKKILWWSSPILSWFNA